MKLYDNFSFSICILVIAIVLPFQMKGQINNWAKALSGAGGEKGQSISIDDNGNVYSTGWYNMTVDFDPGPGIYNLTAISSTDVYVSKLDSAGNFAWAKSYGSIGFPLSDQGKAIYASPSGDVLVAGFILGQADFNPGGSGGVISSFGDFDVFVLKLDGAGNFLWVKQIGGGGLEDVESITEDALGNVYVSGSFSGTCDFDPGPGSFNMTNTGISGLDAFIVKLNMNGDFIWGKQFGGPSSEITNVIKIDNNNDLYVAGSFRLTVDFDPGPGNFSLTSSGPDDIFIAKLDSAGNLLFAKAIGGSYDDNVSDMVIDVVGNIYFTGFFLDTVDFDPGFGTFNMYSGSIVDSYICKLDSGGNFVWARQFDGNDSQLSTSIDLDGNGNIYTAGWFNDIVDFDPGPGIFMLNSSGNSDIFICQLNSAGNFNWANSTGSSGFDQVTAMDVWSNNFFITGEFRLTVDFDFLTSVNNLSVNFDRDAFVAKYSIDYNTSVDYISNPSNGLVYYPNPSSHSLTIVADEKMAIRIYNLSGQVVKEIIISSGINIIDISHLEAGLYFIGKWNSEKEIFYKLVKT